MGPGAGRGVGKKPIGPGVAKPGGPPAGIPETGYQSDEEDTAVPMSYDEKRQVQS